MAYVPVPKDLTHVRQKVLFNLTRRQLVCFLGGALVGAPLFYLLKPYVASSAASLVMVLVMIPFILLGVYEKNGEPLEVVLKHFFTATFLRPKKRPYQSENLYDALERQSALQKDVAQIEKKKKRKKLSREEKKLIRTKIKEADRRQETPHTAQKTIPYQRMYPDGICRVTDTRYTRTIQFQDINYQLSQNEDKQALFDGWCDFLNYFDPSIHFQFSFFDLAANPKVFEQRIDIPAQNDDFDSIRAEYANMLRSQLAMGNNGLQKQKYLTFGIEADSYKAAKTRLERIELDLLNNFRKLGVQAKALDGKARLELMHGICHMDTREPFRFDWSWLVPSGLTTQDFIAPSSFEFKDGRTFRIGKTYCAASYLQILAPELSDRTLKNFLDMESSLLVSMHIHSLDQAEAVKTIKHKITELDRTKIEEQKKAVRAGYDMDIIPSDLATYGEEAKKLLQDLQSHNERMFLLTLAGCDYTDYNLVIAFPNGHPCEEKRINQAFTKLKAEAKLPDVVFHSLRHSSATYKLKLNHGDLKATQGDTGHAEIDMLTKVYAHILDADRKITAQRFEEAFYQSQDLPEQKDNSPSSPDIAALITQIQQYPELGKILSNVLAKQTSTDENTENGNGNLSDSE